MPHPPTHHATTGAPAILADNVQLSFGDVVALAGLNLEVEPGTVFGLLGPNGAGKTTLVRVLATLLRPTAGHARVLGYDVVAEPLAVRRRIGLAGQFAAVDEELTGRENLEMVGTPVPPASRRGARPRRRRPRPLQPHRRRRPARLDHSGGMRRRLDLGASLTGRPPVILLDEPTTGLDPRTRQELWDAVDELRRAGTTILLTTQYLDEADRLAQRIAIVDHGRIAAEGTTAELKARVGADVLVVRVTDTTNTADAGASLADLTNDGKPVVDNAAGEIRLAVVDPNAAAEAVRRLDAKQVAIAAIELQQPTLDDVFLTLTGRPAEPDAADQPTTKDTARTPQHSPHPSDTA